MNCKVDHKLFRAEIERRGIEYLVHFTPTLNLYSILEQDQLLSRDCLENLDIKQFDVLDYVQFTDSVRYDDKRYINLSISGPNTFLFSKFRERTKDNFTITWCILKIHPKYIYQKGTLFAVTNAASRAAKNIGITGDIEKFKLIFADRIDTPYGIRGRIHPRFPTNVQAEVLVKDSIPAESILEICFDSEASMNLTKASLYEFDTSKFIVDSEVFKPRKMYETRNKI